MKLQLKFFYVISIPGILFCKRNTAIVMAPMWPILTTALLNQMHLYNILGIYCFSISNKESQREINVMDNLGSCQYQIFYELMENITLDVKDGSYTWIKRLWSLNSCNVDIEYHVWRQKIFNILLLVQIRGADQSINLLVIYVLNCVYNWYMYEYISLLWDPNNHSHSSVPNKRSVLVDDFCNWRVVYFYS